MFWYLHACLFLQQIFTKILEQLWVTEFWHTTATPRRACIIISKVKELGGHFKRPTKDQHLFSTHGQTTEYGCRLSSGKSNILEAKRCCIHELRSTCHVKHQNVDILLCVRGYSLFSFSYGFVLENWYSEAGYTTCGETNKTFSLGNELELRRRMEILCKHMWSNWIVTSERR